MALDNVLEKSVQKYPAYPTTQGTEKNLVEYREDRIRRILMHGGDRRSLQRNLKRSVGYAELSGVLESDMSDTTVLYLLNTIIHKDIAFANT